MSVFPRVIFDESHSQAWSIDPLLAERINPSEPADASYARAAEVLRRRGCEVWEDREGALTRAGLTPQDVLVIAHPAAEGTERVSGIGTPVFDAKEIDAIEQFVASGGGLLVLGECDQDKYGTNLNELVGRFGLQIDNVICHDGRSRNNGVSSWVMADFPDGAGQGALSGVTAACFYRSGTVRVTQEGDGDRFGKARVVARTSEHALPAEAPLAIGRRYGKGRVVVFGDSDLFGDAWIDQYHHIKLWWNIVMWTGGSPTATQVAEATETSHPSDEYASDPRWLDLKAAVEELRPMQSKDGSVDAAAQDHDKARTLVDRIIAGVEALAPEFPHDAEYLKALPGDFRKWADGGFGVPDFLDSLNAFRPDLCREDGIVHLVVFPMYTQNGNRDRNVEAVLCRVLWPDWLAEIEKSYDNKAFLSIEFIDFTPGYDTNSAVLFPETVAVREVPDFHWGAIFSDREAARFRSVVKAATSVLKVDLPPLAQRVVASQPLCQNVFAMWDLIHDRTHSHGDLPFDPFMIKQRMPYWMYALEELRCDLNTYREGVKLHSQWQPFARPMQYAIVFDRIFRFSITGGRVRNYDGLGGQLLFAWLHKRGALRWTDNKLRFDWVHLPEAVVALADEVDRLYREGIDRSKVGHWLACHEFISQYVQPNPRSVWAKGAEALPLDGTNKEIVDTVLDDEFPLNVFFEALHRKINPVVEATEGITPARLAAQQAEQAEQAQQHGDKAGAAVSA